MSLLQSNFYPWSEPHNSYIKWIRSCTVILRPYIFSRLRLCYMVRIVHLVHLTSFKSLGPTESDMMSHRGKYNWYDCHNNFMWTFPSTKLGFMGWRVYGASVNVTSSLNVMSKAKAILWRNRSIIDSMFYFRNANLKCCFKTITRVF